LTGAFIHDYREVLGPGIEYYEAAAVVGRRPLEVHELGLSLSWGPPWKRKRLYKPGPTRRYLPDRLEDGEVVETGFELGALIDDLIDELGDALRRTAVVQPYVLASGKRYHGRIIEDNRWEAIKKLGGSWWAR
jgi:hypothetical protein